MTSIWFSALWKMQKLETRTFHISGKTWTRTMVLTHPIISQFALKCCICSLSDHIQRQIEDRSSFFGFSKGELSCLIWYYSQIPFIARARGGLLGILIGSLHPCYFTVRFWRFLWLIASFISDWIDFQCEILYADSRYPADNQSDFFTS